jgi:hypothetical protein
MELINHSCIVRVFGRFIFVVSQHEEVSVHNTRVSFTQVFGGSLQLLARFLLLAAQSSYHTNHKQRLPENIVWAQVQCSSAGTACGIVQQQTSLL